MRMLAVEEEVERERWRGRGVGSRGGEGKVERGRWRGGGGESGSVLELCYRDSEGGVALTEAET